MLLQETIDIIRKSAKELAIDSEKDEGTKLKNSEVRTQVIGFIDMLLDRELYCMEFLTFNAFSFVFG